ncbi:hypothetical protein BAE44_0019979 [Dichanthelium oligosanthes]|uniref:HMA domain-containing protein n=1 Tax=Dichanthelium oligosanthes TaxID=888268 RepID=A0A1E5V1L1_9POAL|nr:hypothetical protein BAE44_0019979 [Dichanthelium oligosanthes]
MAPVVLSMDVHCDSCAKKIRKAAMKVPGAESVTASFETGLVVVEGTADAAALRARIKAKTGKPVKVVSDGAEEGEPAPAAAAACRLRITGRRRLARLGQLIQLRRPSSWRWSCTAAPAPRRRGHGHDGRARTADASAVATSLEVRMGRPVRVVSDLRRADVPAGYDHEWRKASAARAAAQQMQEMYGAMHVEPQEAATDASSLSSLSSAPSSSGSRRRRRTNQRAPSPPGQSVGISRPLSPPASSYGAPPPQGGYGYYYPAPGGVYGGQEWAAAAPPSGGFYMHQGGEMFGGQQWPAYPPPAPEPEGYCPSYSGQQGENPGSCGYYPYGGQQDENPGGCSIQRRSSARLVD